MMRNSNKIKMSSWQKQWEAMKQQPVVRSTRPRENGKDFTALVISREVREKSIRFNLRLQADLTLGETTFPAGQELDVSQWKDSNDKKNDVNKLDLVRVEGCYVSSSSNNSGRRIYYNCRDVKLVKACWEMTDDELVAYGGNPFTQKTFLVVSRKVEASEVWSDIVWPGDVTLTPRDKAEMPFLHFKVQYMQVNDDDDDEAAKQLVYDLKMWTEECKQLLPGATLEQWKALTPYGLNPVPFVALCSVKRNQLQNPFGHKELYIQALRVDFEGYLRQQAVEVSRDLVETHVKRGRGDKDKKKLLSSSSSFINVSQHGLTKDTGGPFPTFHALTSAPDELTDEEQVVEALEQSTVGCVLFYALPSDPKAASSSKTMKKRRITDN